MKDNAPLHGLRVIDLATNRAELAGRLLADLGAEVIKVEPPGGAAARYLPPFEDGREGDPDASLYWASVGLGKKSVVLDINDPVDATIVRRLAATADVLFESDDPGVLAKLGLGYEQLGQVNPALVYVSVTPYGQDGPDAGSPATDLTIEAAGGLLGLQGDGDRPPVPVGYPQASFHAGAQAAADAVIALHERSRSGLGQYLDVSMQACIIWTLMNATGYPPAVGRNPPGYCEERAIPLPEMLPGLAIPRLFDCADGSLSYTITLPEIGPRTHQQMMRWLEEVGALDADLHGIDWSNWIGDVVSGKLSVEQMSRSVDATRAFMMTKSKHELQSAAADRGMLLAAIYTVPDLLTDPQLVARDYWTTVAGRVHPGAAPRLSRTPARLPGPAPRLGADQSLLDGLPPLPAGPAVAQVTVTGRQQAFEGLKVADFAWVGVGPIISKALADHGATVVHVESVVHPDVLRQLPPYRDGVPGINRSQFMANFNTSKLGLACDLSTREGRELAHRLIGWADVVVESFTPGTMAKLGLDYETLAKEHPGLVMLSTCLRGQTGPQRTYGGFGGQGAALAAIASLTGWPDRSPCGPWGAYTDFIGPRFGIPALGAALLHRQRTGEGQYIDLAQGEAGIHFIEPLVLDYTVNGRAPVAAGHKSPHARLQGVFRAAGQERYIAIGVENEAQWDALRGAIGAGATRELSFDALCEASANEAAIAALAAWCLDRDPFELAQELKDRGVPASAVLWPTDLYTDPQLAHRKFFVTLEHGEMGPTPYDGPATLFSATPAKLRSAAPCLGQDTDYVLREVLGLGEEEIMAYAMSGALS